MKKSICIEKIFTEYSFYERFKKVAECGFEYVEFWSWKGKDLKRIKELSERYGLKIASISGDKDYSLCVPDEQPEYLDYFIQSLEAAKYLDCGTVVIHSDAIDEFGKIKISKKAYSNIDKLNAMADTLEKVADIASRMRILTVLEALNTNTQPGCCLYTTQAAATLVRHVNSPYVKLLYDVWHMEQMEGDIEGTLKKYGKEIGYIHIADSNGRHEPGTGTIDFEAMKKILYKISYDGIWGFELTPLECSEKACSVIGKF
ncbi:MAG: TIM barrel protein [Coprococcus sp.]